MSPRQRPDIPAEPEAGRFAANPEFRRRIGRVSAGLMAAILAAIAGLTALTAWHFARRSRVLRERLGDPRPIRWPDPTEGHDDAPEPPR